MNFEQAIQTLQDNLVVIAEIERRHPATLQQHEDSVNQLFKLHAAHTKLLDAMSAAALAQIDNAATTATRINAEAAAFRQRTEQNLAEITDKLNGLIGYIDGLNKPCG